MNSNTLCRICVVMLLMTFGILLSSCASDMGSTRVGMGAVDPPTAEQIAALNFVDNGRAKYEEFRRHQTPKAMALSPDGAWAYYYGQQTLDIAKSRALAGCQRNGRNPCRLFAVNNAVVWEPQPDDAEQYATRYDLPLSTLAEAARASVGFQVGQRLPELNFTDSTGKAMRFEDFRGRVLFVNMVGSWCPYCRQDVPRVQALYDALQDEPGIAFVLLNSGEGYATTKRWFERERYTLPLYNTGTAGGHRFDVGERRFTLPTTFIVDGNGIIQRVQTGAYRDWVTHTEPLRQAARQTIETAGSAVQLDEHGTELTVGVQQQAQEKYLTLTLTSAPGARLNGRLGVTLRPLEAIAVSCTPELPYQQTMDQDYLPSPLAFELRCSASSPAASTPVAFVLEYGVCLVDTGLCLLQALAMTVDTDSGRVDAEPLF
jgi:thiol-disulfide isomerase/thioredoxin